MQGVSHNMWLTVTDCPDCAWKYWNLDGGKQIIYCSEFIYIRFLDVAEIPNAPVEILKLFLNSLILGGSSSQYMIIFLQNLWLFP